MVDKLAEATIFPFRGAWRKISPRVNHLLPFALAHLKETGEPVVLTVKGKEEVVVQDAEAYRRLAQQAARAEMMEFMRRSIADADAGRLLPAREVIESLGQDL